MKTLRCCLVAILIATGIPAAQAITQDELRERIISETAILLDADTGWVLFEKDMHRQMIPASITKVLTALLALERGDLGDTIAMSHEAVHTLGIGAANIALDAGEQLTLEQAMYALSIASANDAANGIAEHIAGSIDAFIGLMNERASQAGALNSNFENAHGMPVDGDSHLTTAYDMAQIMAAAIHTPRFNEIFSAREYDMPPTNIHEEPRVFSSRNPMLEEYGGIIAEKTGYTIRSQHTLATAAKRDGRTLICVVLKSPERGAKYADTALLLDYGFEELPSVIASSAQAHPDGETPAQADDAGSQPAADAVAAMEPAGDIPETDSIAEAGGEDKRKAWVTALMWIVGVPAVLIGLVLLLFAVLYIRRWFHIRRHHRLRGHLRR